jgi:TolB-like protein/DNA-binding winged helix-turn-helix (wHTH) protein/Tfp pilus assembly protein PilF
MPVEATEKAPDQGGWIRFGPFELRLEAGELHKEGIRLKLAGQAIEVLRMLLERPGRLVTREELQKKLWSEAEFGDFEHGLNAAVNRLRESLADSATEPKYIETVPRRGYRFIGAIKQPGEAALPRKSGEEGPQSAVAAADKAAARRKLQDRGIAWIAAAAALLLVWPAYKLTESRFAHPGSQTMIRSIAVLPLENMSGDAEQEYFADGMTDELITMLAKYRSLRVISRTSVMQYKKVRRPLPEIARELGVDGIVTGTIMRAQDRVRVSAQLVYAPTDTHVWAESYDRDLRDVLSLQEDLARSIAERVKLASSTGSSVHAPANTAARDAYFRGRYYWFSGEWEKSREFFQQAIQLDPNYAAAYSGVADSYMAASAAGYLRPLEAMPKGEAAAKKALEVDDSLAEVHRSLGAVKLFYRWDWEGAEKELQRALEINPGLAESHHLHAYILVTRNHMEEALREDKLAIELDPFARPWAYGAALLRARRFDDALKEFKQREGALPNIASVHEGLSQAYAYNGDYEQSFQELKKALILHGHEARATAFERAYRGGGFQALCEARFRSMQTAAARAYVSPFDLAVLATAAGHKEDGLGYLELAVKEHDPRLIFIQHTPELDPLHSFARYRAVVKKLDLPPL